ncbi:MAG: phosphoribosyltransferase family protein [Patescibacteria group bacterium]
MLRDIVAVFLDFLAPPRASEQILRAITLAELHELSYDSDSGALPYTDPAVKALVWELKYHKAARAAELAGQFLSEQLLAVAAEELGKPLLIPVPMHAARKKERGHNQTETLCEAALHILHGSKTSQENSLARERELARYGRSEDFFARSFAGEVFEYVPNILKRVRHTDPQQGLAKHIRLKNVKNSMEAAGPDAGRVAGRVCVVVDDVCTTGATFEEAKRALRLAGARDVHCVALAQS